MDEIDETVLDVAQRMKRGQAMRRNKTKLERGRKIAEKRPADKEHIKKRAYAKARQVVRTRYAGKYGAEYATLSSSEKIAIDRAIENKQSTIKKLALRLIPRIKQADQQRLSSFMKGQQLSNTPPAAPKTAEVHENLILNTLFREAFKDDSKKKKNKKATVEVLNRFDGKVSNALEKKADKSGICLETLGKVYIRGLKTWNEETGLSPEQFAFARVNSFINAGKTYFEEDADLVEEFKKGQTVYLRKQTLPNSPHYGKIHSVTDTHIILAPSYGNKSKYKLHKDNATLNKDENWMVTGNRYKTPVKESLDESKNTPYVKPHYGSPDPTKQTAWKASNKHGNIKYFGLDFKASAHKHAGVEGSAPSEFAKRDELKKKIFEMALKPSDREEGKPSLRKTFKKDTPGQTNEGYDEDEKHFNDNADKIQKEHNKKSDYHYNKAKEYDSKSTLNGTTTDLVNLNKARKHRIASRAHSDAAGAIVMRHHSAMYKSREADKLSDQLHESIKEEVLDENVKEILQKHSYKNIRSDDKSYRGSYEMRTNSKDTHKLPDHLKKTGWKHHEFSVESSPQQDKDGNTYWNGTHKFSHPEHGTIKIPGVSKITHNKTNMFKDKQGYEYSNTAYYKPKKSISEAFVKPPSERSLKAKREKQHLKNLSDHPKGSTRYINLGLHKDSVIDSNYHNRAVKVKVTGHYLTKHGANIEVKPHKDQIGFNPDSSIWTSSQHLHHSEDRAIADKKKNKEGFHSDNKPIVNQAMKEEVKTADKEPVVVPAHKDTYGNTIPAKTVMRKKDKKIIDSGNTHDGENS